jgi:hypothetical protein
MKAVPAHFVSFNLHRSELPVVELLEALSESCFSIACVQEMHLSYNKMSMLGMQYKTTKIVSNSRAAIVFPRTISLCPLDTLSMPDIAVGLWTPISRRSVVIASVYLESGPEIDINLQITYLDNIIGSDNYSLRPD